MPAIIAATGGLGCAASHGSNVAKVAVFTTDVLAGASAARGIVEGGKEMLVDGEITVQNVVKLALDVTTLAVLKSKACFTEDTQIVVGVVYPEGTCTCEHAGVECDHWYYETKAIQDIEVGDWVYSYDTITGETTQRQVTDVFVRESDHINYLTIIDENGSEQIIETTDSHPFWVVTDDPDLSRAARDVVDENGVWIYHENVAPTENGYWVEAKDLRPGDVFIGANGELSTLVSTERVQFEESIKVYNFTVNGDHNYFVIAQTDEYGQTCILVHNAGQYDIDIPYVDKFNKIHNVDKFPKKVPKSWSIDDIKTAIEQLKISIGTRNAELHNTVWSSLSAMQSHAKRTNVENAFLKLLERHLKQMKIT